MRVSSPLIALVLLQLSHAQFDFEKEVAGFFDFGKIPREFSGFSTSGPSSVRTPATVSSVFTVFATDKLPDDDQDQIKEVELQEINAKVSQTQAVTDSFLPEFGEIKKNLQATLSSEGTNSSKENNVKVKRRSYGFSQGGRGYGGGGGGGYGHFGGGGGGYQESGHGAGGGGGYEDDHKGGLVQYGLSSGHKVRPKPPGPFGPAKPNYNCEKTKETLFVTKVEFTSDVKCFTVFSVKCEESYSTGKVSDVVYVDLVSNLPC